MLTSTRIPSTALLALLLGICLPSCVLPPKPYHKDKTAQVSRASIEKKNSHSIDTGKFWWGTSTSSFQNEDRGEKPGSSKYFKTDWDEFAEEGVIPPRGEDATFSWTLFNRDLRTLKDIGVTHYRFGIEWGRVEPRPNEFNEEAIQQYVDMAKKLRARGITPIVTLWHFTFPGWLYDGKKKNRSNFLHPDVEKHWAVFVAKMVTALAPYVQIYVPQNEPNGDLYLGYFAGHWPPALLLTPGSLKKATAVCVRMFREASRIIREKRSDAIVMGIYSIPKWNRNYLQDPTGFVYNMMMHQNFDHLDQVVDYMDVIGVNYYYSQDASALRFIVRPQGEVSSNYTQNGWEIIPEGLYEVLMDVSKRYDKPIVITENGIGTQSEQKKIRYFREHINQMRRAMNDGVDVRGYMPWTLIDNYEWAEGYGANFGLTRMDKKSKDLIPEPSGHWFKEFIKVNPEP
ncbi:MAG: glycoside hydrolase family 1 protein [Chthoniobacterales bacterium]